jgi:threonyl-tRNA synthetase
VCRPHLAATGEVKAFKLTQVAGAYCAGSEKNKMLQRIYGTSFPDKQQLKDYLDQQEEAKKRDHNKLGRELAISRLSTTLARVCRSCCQKGHAPSSSCSALSKMRKNAVATS